VKTFDRDGDQILLRPANASMEPLVFDAADVAVFGKVVTVLRKL
jgi:SOS-response transcriptional repressor LexA